MASLDEGYAKALAVMNMNATRMGFSASTEKYVNYFSIWARDHSISSIAAVLTGDKHLISTSVNGIISLLKNQDDNGQVPSYIEIESRKRVYGGLGSITSIDSNMWVVIAAGLLLRRTKNKRLLTKRNVERYFKLYRLIIAFDSNACGLIESHIAGDWADVFDRTYHVLYDECLYYEALNAIDYIFEKALDKNHLEEKMMKRMKIARRKIRKRKAQTKRQINNNFWFTEDNLEKISENYMWYSNVEFKNYEYYQSHLRPFEHYWEEYIDPLGNILAIAIKIANKNKAKTIIKYILKNNIHKPFPMTALSPPVFPQNEEWKEIYAIKEKPHTYHNGGIWPMIGGFWIYVLVRNGFMKQAKDGMKDFHDVLEKQNWTFNEYMHGESGEPMGRQHQCWSAAGYVLAYHILKDPHINLFNFR